MMQTTNVLRIAKWRDTFERAESRKLKSLTWVSLPTSFTSSGYQAMLDEFGDDAPSIYGAWCAMVVIAAGCNVRGVLADSRGNPLKTSWIARMSGFPVTVYEKLITWAASPQVQWLDSVPATEIQAALESEQQKPDDSDSSGESPDAPPTVRGNPPHTQPNLTKPNQTKHNITQPHQTGASTTVGPIDWGDRWRIEDESFLILVREIANKFAKLRSPTPLDREYVWRVAWVSAAFDRSVADGCVERLREREVRKPQAYLDAAMRKLCSDRGEHWETIREKVPPSPKLIPRELEIAT